jgi:hypothetical protein
METNSKNMEPRVRYCGIFKLKTDNKFGEFSLSLSNINIVWVMGRLFTRVSSVIANIRPNSNYAEHIVYRINRICTRKIGSIHIHS